MTMSQTSTNPALKWILIVIAVVTALGAIVVYLMAKYPASEYRVARELQMRGFRIDYHWLPNNNIWQRPANIHGTNQMITSDDCQLFGQLPRLHFLQLERCDMSGLNFDEIKNCKELHTIKCLEATRFPVGELKKLTVCPVRRIWVISEDVDLNDSDLEEFAKFTNLESIELEFNNAGVTDACLEYFEKIPTLKSLILSGSSITPEGTAEFKKKRPDVGVLLK